MPRDKNGNWVSVYDLGQEKPPKRQPAQAPSNVPTGDTSSPSAFSGNNFGQGQMNAPVDARRQNAFDNRLSGAPVGTTTTNQAFSLPNAFSQPQQDFNTFKPAPKLENNPSAMMDAMNTYMRANGLDQGPQLGGANAEIRAAGTSSPSLMQRAKDVFNTGADVTRAAANQFVKPYADPLMWLMEDKNGGTRSTDLRDIGNQQAAQDAQTLTPGVAKGLNVAGLASQYLLGGEVLAPAKTIQSALPFLNTAKTGLGLRATAQGVAETSGLINTALNTGLTAAAGETLQGAFSPNSDPSDRNLMREFGASIESGTGQNLSTLGSAADWLGMKNLANDLKQSGNQLSSQYEIHPNQQEFGWKSLLDPKYYAQTLGSTLPTTLALMPLGLAGAAGGGILAGGIAAATKMRPFTAALTKTILQAAGASALSTPVEAAMEAGGVYEQMRNEGKSEAEANHAANQTFAHNMELLLGTNALEYGNLLMPKGLSHALEHPISRIGSGFVMEGGEEAAQDAISRHAQGKPIAWDASMQEQFMVGGLFGGLTGTAGVLRTLGEADTHAENIGKKVISKLPDADRTDVIDALQRAHEQGIPEKEAMAQILDTVIQQHPHSEQLMKDVVDETIASEKLIEEAKRPALNVGDQQAGVRDTRSFLSDGEIQHLTGQQVKQADSEAIGGTPLELSMNEVDTTANPAVQWKQMSEKRATMVNLSPAGKANHMREMKAFAEQHGIEWNPHNEELLNRFETEAVAAKQAQQGQRAGRADYKNELQQQADGRQAEADKLHANLTELAKEHPDYNDFHQYASGYTFPHELTKGQGIGSFLRDIHAQAHGEEASASRNPHKDKVGQTVSFENSNGDVKTGKVMGIIDDQMVSVETSREDGKGTIPWKVHADDLTFADHPAASDLENPKVGDRVWLKNLKGGFTVTGVEGKMVTVKGDKGGETKVSKKALDRIERPAAPAASEKTGDEKSADFWAGVNEKHRQEAEIAAGKTEEDVKREIVSSMLTDPGRGASGELKADYSALIDAVNSGDTKAAQKAFKKKVLTYAKGGGWVGFNPYNGKVVAHLKDDRQMTFKAEELFPHLSEVMKERNAAPAVEAQTPEIKVGSVITTHDRSGKQHKVTKLSDNGDIGLGEGNNQFFIKKSGVASVNGVEMPKTNPDHPHWKVKVGSIVKTKGTSAKHEVTSIDSFGNFNTKGGMFLANESVTSVEEPAPAAQPKASFKMPWEMSKAEFMADDTWVAKHADHKEQKQAHTMIQPNGEAYPGGWTAHGPNPKKAKESFHEQQLHWQLRKDVSSVSPKAVEAYPDQKLDYENFKAAKALVKVNGEQFTITVDGVDKTFNVSDFNKNPIQFDIIRARGFVSEHKLVGEEFKNRKMGQWDAREVISSAIYQKIKEAQNPSAAPATEAPKSNKAAPKYKKGDKVEWYDEVKGKNLSGVIDTVDTVYSNSGGTHYEIILGGNQFLWRKESEISNPPKIAEAKTAPKKETPKQKEARIQAFMDPHILQLSGDYEKNDAYLINLAAQQTDPDIIAAIDRLSFELLDHGVQTGEVGVNEMGNPIFGRSDRAGKGVTIKTERGTSVKVRYEVQDAGALDVSHDPITGEENPDYPQELQPRDRSRTASEEQVNRILGKLEPTFLGESPKTSEGAPIVSPNGMTVESGNGRAMALIRGYGQNHKNMAKYKTWLQNNLAKFGLSENALEGIAHPILVRVRQTEMTNAERAKFTQESNEQSVAAMSAVEQAAADAKRITGDIMMFFNPGDGMNLMAQSNREFVRRFMEKVVGANERSRYITADGALNQDGIRRITNAVFARTYGDSTALEKLAESTDNNVRNITNAMLQASPQLVKMKEAMDAGTQYDSLDITDDIADAMAKLSDLRDQGQTVEDYFNQGDLFGSDLSDAGTAILTLFDQNKKSAKAITSFLKNYANRAEAAGDPNQPDLFGGKVVPTKLETIQSALEGVKKDGDQIVFEEPATGRAGTDRQGGSAQTQEKSSGEVKADRPFPKSKVQDTVYHGSGANNIQEFFTTKEELGGNTGASTARLGAFFSESEDIATVASFGFSIHGAFDKSRDMTLYETKINMEHPLDMDNLSQAEIKQLDERFPGFAKAVEKSDKEDRFSVVQFLSRFREKRPEVSNFATYGREHGLTEDEINAQFHNDSSPVFREWWKLFLDQHGEINITKALQELGYDGIIVKTMMDSGDLLGPQKQYVVFRPQDIKIIKKSSMADLVAAEQGAETKVELLPNEWNWQSGVRKNIANYYFAKYPELVKKLQGMAVFSDPAGNRYDYSKAAAAIEETIKGDRIVDANFKVTPKANEVFIDYQGGEKTGKFTYDMLAIEFRDNHYKKEKPAAEKPKFKTGDPVAWTDEYQDKGAILHGIVINNRSSKDGGFSVEIKNYRTGATNWVHEDKLHTSTEEEAGPKRDEYVIDRRPHGEGIHIFKRGDWAAEWSRQDEYKLVQIKSISHAKGQINSRSPGTFMPAAYVLNDAQRQALSRYVQDHSLYGDGDSLDTIWMDPKTGLTQITFTTRDKGENGSYLLRSDGALMSRLVYKKGRTFDPKGKGFVDIFDIGQWSSEWATSGKRPLFPGEGAKARQMDNKAETEKPVVKQAEPAADTNLTDLIGQEVNVIADPSHLQEVLHPSDDMHAFYGTKKGKTDIARTLQVDDNGHFVVASYSDSNEKVRVRHVEGKTFETLPMEKIKLHISLSPNLDEIEAIRRERPPAVLLSYNRWNGHKWNPASFIKAVGYKPTIIADNGAASGKDVGMWDVMDFFKNEWELDPGMAYLELERIIQGTADPDMVKEIKKQFPEYVKFHKWFNENHGSLDYVMAPDSMHPGISADTRQEMANYAYQFFKPSGVKFIPVFQFGAEPTMINELIDEGADYIAIGGTKDLPDAERIKYANAVISKYPNVKWHLLGTNSEKVINAIPGLYSADGTTWQSASRGRAAKETAHTAGDSSDEAKGIRREARAQHGAEAIADLTRQPTNEEKIARVKQRITNLQAQRDQAAADGKDTTSLDDMIEGQQQTLVSLGEKTAAAPATNQNISLKNDNHRRPFKDHGIDTLYREMDGESLMAVMPGSNVMDISNYELQFATVPEMALGQGNNKGFLVEFKSDGLEGHIKNHKPGLAFAATTGALEVETRYAKATDYRKNLVSVTAKPDAKMAGSEKTRFKKWTEGWRTVKNDDGSTTYFNPAHDTQPAAPASAPPVVEDNRTPHQQMIDFRKKLQAGEATADEVRKQFDYLTTNKEAILADTFASLKKLPAYKGKRNATIEKRAADMWEHSVQSLAYADSDTFSYTLSFSGDPTANMLKGVKAHLDKMTDESIQKHQAKKQAGKEADKKAIENPETLQELQQKKNRSQLTVEEQRRYDDLLARDVKERKAKQKETSSAAATVSGGSYDFNIRESKHTKTGETIWVASLKERIPTDQFNALRTQMGKIGGNWYGGGAGGNNGFIFKSDPTEKVAALSGGTTETADTAEEAPQGSKAAAKLRQVADNMQNRIDDLHGERLTNTHKRATEAAHAIKEGDNLKRLQQVMRNIADAIDSGEAIHLDGISARTHVELLDRLIRTRVAENMNRDGEKAMDRNGNYHYRDPKLEDIDGVTYPTNTVNRDNLAELIEGLKLAKIPGTMRNVAKLDKLLHDHNTKDANSYRVDIDRYADELQSLITAIRNIPAKDHIIIRPGKSRINLPDVADRVNDNMMNVKRLEAMGIETPEQLRAALREYLTHREGTGVSDEVKKQRELQQREGEAARSNIPGFFPTPKSMAEQMVEEADIQPGMDVLEPSAGKGNIADAIREAHPDAKLQVIEYNNSLRNILTDKGHNVLDEGDFLQHTATPLYQFDRIVMNPPFENGQDIDHVQHAYDLLKPGGRIVAIMSEGPFFRGDKKATAFRDWLDQHGGTSEKNGEGAFKSSERPTGVATRTVVIDKPAAAKATSTLESAENEIRSLDVEHGYVFDENGNETYRTKGSYNAVAVPSAEMKEGYTYTHNHPGGGTFSPSDFNTFKNRKLKEMRAVEPDFTYSFAWKKFPENYVQAVNELVDEVERLRNELNLDGNFKDSQHAKYHELWTRVAAGSEYLSYTRTPTGVKLPDPSQESTAHQGDTAEERAAYNVNAANNNNGVGFVHALFRGKPKGPAAPAAHAVDDAAIEARFQDSHGRPKESLLQKIGESMIVIKNKLREFEHLPKTPQFELIRQKLLQLMNQEEQAKFRTFQVLLQDIVMGLSKEDFALFKRKVIMDDLHQENLIGNKLPLGFEANRPAFDNYKVKTDNLVAGNRNVQDALKKRKAAWDGIKDAYFKAMADIGYDATKKINREDYFRHQVIQTAEQIRTGEGVRKLRTPTNRSWQNKRKGYEGDINTDYLQAESEVMIQMLFDIKKAEVIKVVDDHYNVIEKFKAEAQAAGVNWRTLVDKSGTHKRWQPRDGSIFFRKDDAAQLNDLFAEIMSAVATQEEADIVNELQANVLKAIGQPVLAVGGKRREFVLPVEVADTLDSVMVNPFEKSGVYRGISKVMRPVKKTLLLGPKNFVKYNFRNVTSDLDKTFAGNPRALKQVPQAFKDLLSVFYGEAAGSAELRNYIELGGLQNLQLVKETGDSPSMRAYKRFLEKETLAVKSTVGVFRFYWHQAGKFNNMREAILRYANYLEYLQQMQNQPQGLPLNYGSSDRERVKALPDLRDRAYKLSNELLVDYNATSTLGRELSDIGIYPFFRWAEGNMKSTLMLFKNAYHDGMLTKAVGRKVLGQLAFRSPYLAYRAGKLAVGMSALSLLFAAWNNGFFPDEEKDLSERDRNSLHLTFGRDATGKPRIIGRLGAVEDFFEWFGMDNFVSDFRSILNGHKTLQEAITEGWHKPVSKAALGTSLLWQAPVNSISGLQLFPDPFHPTLNNSAADPWLDMLGVTKEYHALEKWLNGTPGKPYNALDLVTNGTDPGEAAYYDLKDMIRRYQTRNSLSTSIAGMRTDRSNALYNYKQAMRYNDDAAKKKYLQEYVLRGGTKQGFGQSLRALNPLYGLSNQHKKLFISQLNKQDQETYNKAMDFYLHDLHGDPSTP